MAIKRRTKKTVATTSAPNKYIKNDSVTYDSKVDVTEEYNVRSKELANEGIDLVSKGTIDRSQGERMLKEGKALKDISKELNERGSENLRLSKEHRAKGQEEKATADEIQKKIDQLNKEIKRLQKKHDATWSSATKNIDRAEILYGEGTDQVERANNTQREADNMLEEAAKLYDIGEKEIEKGNTLIDKSKTTSNIPKKDIGKYTQEHFTGEYDLDRNAINEQAVQNAEEANEDKK